MYLIQQNSFDISCSSQDFGIELQSQLGTLLEKTFYPQLEQLLVKYDVQSHHWVVDKLEIELLDISKKYWKEELVQKSLAQIEEFLIRNSPKTEGYITGILDNDSYTIPSEIKAELLVFDYLRNGYFSVNTFSDKIEKIMEVVVIDNNFVNQLSSLFVSDMDALLRWIFSIPEEYKIKVLGFLPRSFNGFRFIKILLEESVFQKGEIKQILEKLFSSDKNIQQWYELIQWIENLSIKISYPKLFAFLNYTLEKYRNVSIVEIYKLLDSVHQRSQLNDSEITFFRHWQNYIKESAALNLENRSTDKSFSINEILDQIKKDKKMIVEPVFYINNAGLVILHPFLPNLFQKLGLTVNNEWLNKQAKQKAVLLTHYLVFGDHEIEENQLILNKILCGFSIEDVIDVQLVLNNDEKVTCQRLLEAVLEHWAIMKNSSKEALQETFLKREGKLEIQFNGFEMWMEEKGYDILLDQLPWGIGMIQTPWMESYLTCNWKQ